MHFLLLLNSVTRHPLKPVLILKYDVFCFKSFWLQYFRTFRYGPLFKILKINDQLYYGSGGNSLIIYSTKYKPIEPVDCPLQIVDSTFNIQHRAERRQNP